MARDHVLRPGGITSNLKPENSNFGGGGWKRNPIFLWTDIFNLMAQSLTILLCAPCSLFFVAAFSSLQTDLALDELLSQIEIYFFQLPIKAGRLDHLNIRYITCQCTYLVICRHVFLTYTVLLCAIVNRNCNMDVSLYYKFFPLLMKNYCLIDILRITENGGVQWSRIL